MKKSSVIVLVAVAVCLLGVALYWLSTSKWRGRYLVYENTRYGFSVDYPIGWELGEPPANNDGREFISKDRQITCRAYGFANALVGSSGEAQTLDEFVDWLTKDAAEEAAKAEVLERSGSTLGGKPAIKLYLVATERIEDAIYALDSETGYALTCIYPDIKTREENKDIFLYMAQSMRIEAGRSSSEEATLMADECDNLLSGAIEPLRDRRTFTDTNYTEVTLTERESWDKAKLPKEVGELEAKGYLCYPAPLEFDEQSEAAPQVQRAVKKVEWSCEQNYEDYKYLASEEETAPYLSRGYSCEKQECFGADGKFGFVWLCAH